MPNLRESSAAEELPSETSEVAMKLTYLEAFHTHGEECDQSKYAANGMDDARLKALIKSPPCDCGCVVPLSTLRRVCRTFWSMEKANQDAVLWSLLSTSGRKKTWTIEGLVFVLVF